MKIRTIISLLFILVSTTIYAQKRVKVTGYVRDADGNPLELVNILVKNSLNGTMTNEKGFYSLNVTPGDSVTFIPAWVTTRLNALFLPCKPTCASM